MPALSGDGRPTSGKRQKVYRLLPVDVDEPNGLTAECRPSGTSANAVC